MTPQTLGILVGGIAPAFAYALFALWTKSSNQAGIGPGPFLMCLGAGCALVGAVFSLVLPATWNGKSVAHALAAGLVWALGTGLVSLALARFGAPLSRLVPLYNTNTLIAVLLALVVFAEWKQVQIWPLLGGAVLILAGSLLVVRA